MTTLQVYQKYLSGDDFRIPVKLIEVTLPSKAHEG